jgi:MOSC domain-containing protein YiiM
LSKGRGVASETDTIMSTVPRLVSVNTNLEKQFRKVPRAEARLVANFGLEGDRHAGRPLRQVSILNAETVSELAQRGMPVEPGVLGENITIEGIPVMRLADGSRLRIGEAELEITGDRPSCREMLEVHRDALKAMSGRAGKMARVVRSGTVRPGDPIELIGVADAHAHGVSGQHTI